MNKRGFSTLMLIVLGSVFFMIIAGTAVYFQSENEQMVSNARSVSSGSRLSFIAQLIQLDFYNNFLQNDLESSIATFLVTEGPHTIDPDRSFYENLGGRIENYMSSKASLKVYSDAGEAYATAYGSLPKISCEPQEEIGGMAQFNVNDAGNGVLEISGTSVGQRIYCSDDETGQDLEISLLSRSYRLQTRAFAIFEKARSAIEAGRQSLDGTYGTHRLGSGWRVWPTTTDEAKMVIISTWNGAIAGLSSGIPTLVGNSDGISVQPGSMKISSSKNTPFSVTDLAKYECDGKMGDATATGEVQTCRPDDIRIVIGKEKPADAKGLALELKQEQSSSNAVEVTIEYFGVGVTMSSNLIGKLIGPLIKDMIDRVNQVMKGYATYDPPATLLCNAFKGKPGSSVISGRVVDSNARYVPAGYNELSFDFISTPQSIETSNIEATKDCTGQEDIINKNLLNLLVVGEPKGLQLTVEEDPAQTSSTDKKKLVIKKEELETLAAKIQNNPMHSTTGEGKSVNLYAEVVGEGTSNVKADPKQGGLEGSAQTPATTEIATGNPTGDSGNKISKAVQSGNSDTALIGLMREYETASGEMMSIGRTTDAKAFSDSAASVCKMMGVKSWMDLSDFEKALTAMCGLANICNSARAKAICNLAGLYAAVESGSVQAVLAQLARILQEAGFDSSFLKTASILAAIQSGDIEALLKEAMNAAVRAGDLNAAEYLAALASLINDMENGGDVMAAAAAIFAIAGETELSQFFASLQGLMNSIESGDARAVLHAAGEMAKSLGFSGLAQFESTLSVGENLVDLLANLDDLVAACEESGPWDLICLTPAVGGGVCEDPLPMNPDCTLDLAGMKAAMPTLDPSLICNDLVFDLGFQVDCTCMYKCVKFPYYTLVPKTVRVNLNDWLMFLNPDQYAGIFNDMEGVLASGDIMQYCKLDP